MDKPEKLDISYMGPIFKKYRLDAKRTQDEVAEKVGITTRFLMALENEEKRLFFGQFLPRIFSQNHYILWFIIYFSPYHHNTSSESRLRLVLRCPN